MKIIHITPSYKPAYIYGGPIYSVGKLCEALEEFRAGNKKEGVRNNEQLARSNEHGAETKMHEVKSVKFEVESLKIKDRETNNDSTNNFSTSQQQKANAQRPMTNDFRVFTTTANGKKELNVVTGGPQMLDGVEVTYFKRLTKDHSHFSPALLSHLRKVLREAQQDKYYLVLHIHAWWNLVSVLSCAIAKWYNIPVVLSPRGMLNSYTTSNRNSIQKKLLHQFFGRQLLRYCHFHATSKQEKDEILRIITPKSITVIPNLINFAGSKPLADKLFPLAKVETRELSLLFLSRIEEKKGLELLFQSLTKLKIAFKLTVAGTGLKNYVDELKNLAEELNISQHITWLGYVSDNKFELLEKNDLLVLPSYNENFANVVVESLSVGTPVLISEHVGLADYVNENGFGWITSLQPKTITKTLMEAAKDLKKRQHIRTSAPQKITEDFDDGTLAKRYLRMYEDVLNFGQR